MIYKRSKIMLLMAVFVLLGSLAYATKLTGIEKTIVINPDELNLSDGIAPDLQQDDKDETKNFLEVPDDSIILEKPDDSIITDGGTTIIIGNRDEDKKTGTFKLYYNGKEVTESGMSFNSKKTTLEIKPSNKDAFIAFRYDIVLYHNEMVINPETGKSSARTTKTSNVIKVADSDTFKIDIPFSTLGVVHIDISVVGVLSNGNDTNTITCRVSKSGDFTIKRIIPVIEIDEGILKGDSTEEVDAEDVKNPELEIPRFDPSTLNADVYYNNEDLDSYKVAIGSSNDKKITYDGKIKLKVDFLNNEYDSFTYTVKVYENYVNGISVTHKSEENKNSGSDVEKIHDLKRLVNEEKGKVTNLKGKKEIELTILANKELKDGYVVEISFDFVLSDGTKVSSTDYSFQLKVEAKPETPEDNSDELIDEVKPNEDNNSEDGKVPYPENRVPKAELLSVYYNNEDLDSYKVAIGSSNDKKINYDGNVKLKVDFLNNEYDSFTYTVKVYENYVNGIFVTHKSEENKNSSSDVEKIHDLKRLVNEEKGKVTNLKGKKEIELTILANKELKDGYVVEITFDVVLTDGIKVPSARGYTFQLAIKQDSEDITIEEPVAEVFEVFHMNNVKLSKEVSKLLFNESIKLDAKLYMKDTIESIKYNAKAYSSVLNKISNMTKFKESKTIKGLLGKESTELVLFKGKDIKDGYIINLEVYAVLSDGTETKAKEYNFQVVKEGKDITLGVTSDWAKSEVEKANENGLIPELFENKDCTEKITRKEFAALAVSLYERKTNKVIEINGENPFTDTNDENILKAYALGVTNGVSETKFAPNNLITREQMSTMMARALEKLEIDTSLENQIQEFDDDAEISDWAQESVYFMNQKGIIKGVGNNKFSAKNNATREQAILISLRCFENM